MLIMINRHVLVLNQNYEPLNICHVRRAIVLIYQNKAEMLEDGAGFLHAASRAFPIPSVIRLPYMVKRPFRMEWKMTRAEIFNRDHHTCQYCGRQTRQLTLDHVIPRSRGGEHTWENVVSACVACNRRKAGRTPEEANMKLHHIPTAPRANRYSYIPVQNLQMRREWERYFPR
jgi:5-methylcytosine-specific restriction endonuclease McrA